MTQMLIAGQIRLRELVSRLQREEGQDIIEYGLLAGLISVSAVFVIILIGPAIRDFFQDVVNALQRTS